MDIIISCPTLPKADPLETLLLKSKGYISENPKLTSVGAVGASYWVPRELITKKLSDELTPVPFGKFEPIQCTYENASRPNHLGIPRFFGLKLFGLPEKDIRSLGRPIFQPLIDLRPLQYRAVDQSFEKLQKWGGCSIIADCGFGKTRVAVALIAKLGRRAMILCNREILMEQWADVIQDLCPAWRISWLQGRDSLSKKKIGKYLGPLEEADICIASIDTVIEDMCTREFYELFGTVVVDECHHLAAPSLVRAMPLLPSKYVIGLSATPDRRDGLEYVLYWLLGPASFVYQRTPEVTGIRNSVIIHKIDVFEGTQFEKAYYNGELAYAEMTTALTQDVRRNKVILDILVDCIQERRKVIVVSSLVKHCDELYEAMITRHSNIKMAKMAGKNVETFKAKDPDTKFVFATYNMLEEGYDDPRLDTLVLCTPRSRIQQTIGRVERHHPDKFVPVVYDVTDSFSIYPSMWYKRQKFYKSRGFLID